MSKPNTDQNPKRRGHRVRVISCYASQCTGLVDSDNMAVLTFSRGQEVLEPYLLSVLQVHVLIRDMTRVLASLHAMEETSTEEPTGATAFANGMPPLPPIPVPPPLKARRRKVPSPSRSSASPKGPIQPTEAWRLHLMLRNVRNHDDFLKLIGADSVVAETNGPVTPAPSQVAELLLKANKMAKKSSPRRIPNDSPRKRK